MDKKHKKSTEELLGTLTNSNYSLDTYLNTNDEQFIVCNVARVLNQMISEKNVKRIDAIRQSDLSPNYAYQIFSGKKCNPSRDIIIALCIGVKLTLEETQKVLKECGYPMLYAKVKRDSIIIYGICHRFSVIEVNERLADHFETLIEGTQEA